MQRSPNAPVAPAGIAFIDGVPVAVRCGQETPRRAGAGNPEYAGHKTAAMVFAADVEVGAAAEEGEDFVPLAGCQFYISYAAMITQMTTRPTESIDVNRAARRARTIAKTTGAECSAVVVGREIPTAERERTTRAGVAIVTVTDASD